ncbi:MAG: HAMP domain-containing sensor histidine kinase [Clostridiaceae bacterium]|nr:HAMP domain-containing sensor histidine kinase [Clostridiaceae bacterium]
MKIKTRILLYNTLMVLISLIALLLIGTIVIGVLGSGQSSVKGNTLTKAEKLMNSLSSGTTSFEDAGRDFSAIGYSLYVLMPEDKVTVYGIEPQEDLTWIMTDPDLETTKLFSLSNNVIIARKISPYLLIAINNAEQKPGGPKSLLMTFLTVGGISIAVILAISYIFTANILRHISKPLSALVIGAGRVELGNLSSPIDYHGSDEFKVVCDAFNRMQEHLKNERDKNAAYEKARTDLISGISHDLRTPLTSVKGYIKGIQDGIANTPEKEQRYLQTAYSKASEMDTLLQKLFFFSKVETGNLPLNKRPIDLADFIRNYVEEASLDPRLQSVSITSHVLDRPHMAEIDSEQLRRVFTNLTENSIKYAGIENLKITITISRDSGFEIITFSDNGKGVSQDMLPYLFEQFWRGDSARKEGGNSSGLGLYIVKYIVDSHGGSVSASNEGGLRITIRLPAQKEVQA